MTESLPLDGESLSLEQFLAVVRGGCAVSLTPEARNRIAASRRVVERAVGAGRTIYGVTTGFGSLADHAIPASEARALQLSLVRSHASGTGRRCPPTSYAGCSCCGSTRWPPATRGSASRSSRRSSSSSIASSSRSSPNRAPSAPPAIWPPWLTWRSR